jgi:Kdo2-lipid IVA lauroyltransferase/acyltransferase
MASTLKKKIRHFRARLEPSFVVLARLLFSRCSRARILCAARLIGDCGYCCARSHVRIAEANLGIIFGSRLCERRRRALIRANFRHTARVLLDLFWFTHDGKTRVERWVGVDADLLAWLREHPGSIVVTGHLGNWEVAGQAVVVHGYPLTSVAKRVGTPETTQRLNHYRRTLGQKIVMADGAVRGLVRALHAGDFAALLLDQHVDPVDGGAWVDLFGLPVAVSSAAARLAMKFKVPVGVCFAQALPDGRYQCRLLGVCRADPGDDPVRVTQEIISLLAGAIRRYPSQWLLSYKRWKRWPPGADAARFPFYARPWKAE